MDATLTSPSPSSTELETKSDSSDKDPPMRDAICAVRRRKSCPSEAGYGDQLRHGIGYDHCIGVVVVGRWGADGASEVVWVLVRHGGSGRGVENVTGATIKFSMEMAWRQR